MGIERRICDAALPTESRILDPPPSPPPAPLFPLREILFRGLSGARHGGQPPTPSAWTPLKLLQLLRFAVMDYPLLLHCPTTRPLSGSVMFHGTSGK